MPRTPSVDKRLLAHLRLIRTESVGPVTYRRLLARCGSAEAALEELPSLARIAGRASPPLVPPEAAMADEIAATLRLGGRFVLWGDRLYPPLLAQLDDAPPCLVVLGDVELLSVPSVAIVGGRNASANGRVMAESLAAGLAPSHCIVSGLARGIDTAAHEGAMSTGRTIAAIAGGIDRPYPPENAALSRRIAANGAVVTEAPLGAEPQARHFPRRNRIIAGLALGVVVVEAARRSGSLITARMAQDAGREIFAVPGSPLDPRAHGGNDLLRHGAVLVEGPGDVLDNLPGSAATGLFPVPMPVVPVPSDPATTTDSARAAVLGLLSVEPVSVDDLVRRCQLSSSTVLAAVLELELAGRVQTLAGARIVLLPDAA